MKLNPYLSSYIKCSSKWIDDLNMTAKIIKLLEENMKVNHHDLGLGYGS